MIRTIRILLLGTILLASGLIHAETKKTITIGVNNWAENIAVANLWKILLDEKGYEVKLQNADKALLYNGVAQGRIDATFEVWLPSADKPSFDKIKDKVALVGPWLPEANLGLAVPDYVTIDSVDQLNANKEDFESRGEPTIVGIDSGSGLMALTTKAKEQYQLDYKVLPSSESGMLLALERALKRKEPVVVTLWKPHWVWAKHKLRYLKDPKGVFGETDSIYGIISKSFKAEHPEVERWMQQWKMDDSSLGGLMAEIIEQGRTDPEKGTRVWLEANRALTEHWLR